MNSKKHETHLQLRNVNKNTVQLTCVADVCAASDEEHSFGAVPMLAGLEEAGGVACLVGSFVREPPWYTRIYVDMISNV
jgi:hypothetical protein